MCLYALSLYLRLRLMTPEQRLASFHDVISIPQTAPDAEHLLHFLRSHRAVCMLEKELAAKKLHQTLLYLQVLRTEVDTATQKVTAAEEDLGMVRAAIRTKDIRGVRFKVRRCHCCYGKNQH